MEIKFVDNLVEKVSKGIGISLNEGIEWAKRLKQRNKETKALHEKKEFKTHFTKPDESMGDQMSQQKYLTYALSFIEKEYPFYHTVLSLRMRGISNKKIADYLTKEKGGNITVEQISKIEAAAIRCVSSAIERIKNTGTPLFGEPVSAKKFSDTGTSRPIFNGTRRKAPNQGVSNV